jgi:toxin ParE1/3/4
LVATRVVGRIRRAGNLLGEQPKIGHAGTASGTREWVVKGLPYVIVHEISQLNGEIVILGVYHGAQLRPGQEQQ